MFERFTHDARQTVVLAQQQARDLRHGWIGTEHLLLALLAQPGTKAGRVLTGHGLDHASVTEAVRSYLGGDGLDADALITLGIDLDAVRERVEATFGPGALDDRAPGCRDRKGEDAGHIPFTPRAKKVLELSLREALALAHRHIEAGHILLGLLREGEGLAMKVLYDRGVDPVDLRRDVTATLVR